MTNYKAEYAVPGVAPEKTPQQRTEHSKRLFTELQDKRYLNKEEPLDPKLYSQKYEYDYDSYFAQPIFRPEQREEIKKMIAETNDKLEGFGRL